MMFGLNLDSRYGYGLRWLIRFLDSRYGYGLRWLIRFLDSRYGYGLRWLIRFDLYGFKAGEEFLNVDDVGQLKSSDVRSG